MIIVLNEKVNKKIWTAELFLDDFVDIHLHFAEPVDVVTDIAKPTEAIYILFIYFIWSNLILSC